MSKYCVFRPSKGTEVFDRLKKEFGYNIAKEVFVRAAVNSQFKSDFKNTLRLTPEGVVTFDSLMSNKVVQDYIGEARIVSSLENNYEDLEDTRENYSRLLESAYHFNTTNDNRNNYVATVEIKNDKIGIKISRKDDASVKRFNSQYSSYALNRRLASIFSPLGVTVGMLTQAEITAGRAGVTDFSKAKEIASGFVSLIRVANNMEGEQALSEEFAHTIIGLFRNNPLVDRCINALTDNIDSLKEILGEDYNDVVQFYTDSEGIVDYYMVAEEALGHILKDNLLKEQQKLNVPSPSLFRRLFNWIRNQFKRFSENDVRQAIIDSDVAMGELARNMLSGLIEISKEDIASSQRNVQLNNLSDRIERNMDILKKVREVEVKRDKITKEKSTATQITIADLNKYMKEDADTTQGIMNYAYEAVQRLKAIETNLNRIKTNADTPNDEIFKTLRYCRTYIKSYGVFIDDMASAMNAENLEDDNMFDREFTFGNSSFTLRSVISELNMLSRQLGEDFISIAIPSFAEFLKPFYGEPFKIPSGRRAGEIVTVEDLIAEAKNGDISLLDRWLDAASDSGDALIQLFDKAIKHYKDEARFETMEHFRTIWALRKKAEDMGITDFEWMFEKDANGRKTGNYVSDANYGEFERQRKEFEEHLNEKYGKNPTGEKAKQKIAERKAWREEYCTSTTGPYLPNPKKFPSESLTANQKEILNEFIALKFKFDNKYPQNRVNLNRAIQMRKYGGQRITDNIAHLGRTFENIKEVVANAVTRREDDDQVFGEEVASGLVNFEGKEHLTLPVLYNNRLKNPDELTTDVFGSLMAYAYAACHYEQMSKCVDPLEVGKILVAEKRKIPETRGSKVIKEKLKHKGIQITSDVQKTSTNIEARINDLMESQIYGRYMKEGGTLEVLGKRVSVNKLTSLVLKYSSMTQLGLNALANLANVGTGLGMTNIEAVSGQFFNVKELARADTIYAGSIVEFVGEIGARTKSSQLALFNELFDIRQNFSEKARRAIQKKSLLQRAFGPSIAFLGQTCGDHWLYSRIGIAMALREKAYVNGKEMNLWDAVKAATIEKDGFKMVDRSLIKDKNGKQLDIAKVARRIAKVNQYCFGVYNEDDANAASRVALGRLLQQYRKWMKIQYSRRFQRGQQNLSTDVWEEGYYRTVGRIVNELIRGERQLGNFTEDEKYNIRRALFEIAQTFAVFALCNFVEWPDDKDRPWLIKLAEYSCRRLSHELGGLTPSTVMPQEILKTIKSPIPSASWALDIFNVVNSALTPSDWVEELQSGPYKGMTRLEKNIIKSPLPYVPWYVQIRKFTGDLDTSIQYYTRPVSY